MTQVAVDESSVPVRDGVHHSLCRVCQAFCGIDVSVQAGRVIKVIGDRDSPNTGGYTCPKGRSLPEQLDHPQRLRATHARTSDGRVVEVPVEVAMDDIAGRMAELLAEYGPRSVALYCATGSAGYPAAVEFSRAFCAALGTPMLFSPATIDQPGKQVAAALHGRWGAHARPMSDSDLWVFIGANPVVSMWGGTALSNPRGRLNEARRRGARLLVIDPRRTETAAMADLHLRPQPGTDPELLAGIIRELIATEAHDAPFCAEHVTGFDVLLTAVEPFTAEAVAAISGVSAADIRAAAELLGQTRRGGVSVGTGPNMAPRSVLSEYLSLCLHTICGYWPRAGEVVRSPGVLAAPRAWVAQPEPAVAVVGSEVLRVRGLHQTVAGMPTGALADEILLPGDGQVRALLCLGGNPVSQWPDEARTRLAMITLDLLVCLDVRETETTRYAHYTVGTKMHLEVPQMTNNEQSLRAYGATSANNDRPFAMYAPRLVAPPPDAQVVEEWELLFGIAQRLGLQLMVAGEPLDMTRKPTTEQLFARITTKARVPLTEVSRYPHGHVFAELEEVRIDAADPNCEHRLTVGDRILEQLDAKLTSNQASPIGEFLLTVRRRLEIKNSFGQDLAPGRTLTINPLGMHPSDLARLGLAEAAVVEVRSQSGRIVAMVHGDSTVLPGTVSLSHGYGAGATKTGHLDGANPNRLIGAEDPFDPTTGQPRMSAIPVTITAAPAQPTSSAEGDL